MANKVKLDDPTKTKLEETIAGCENTVSIGELEKEAGGCAECTESPVCESATDKNNPEASEEQYDADWDCDDECCCGDDDEECKMPKFGDCLKICAAVIAAAGAISLIVFALTRKASSRD